MLPCIRVSVEYRHGFGGSHACICGATSCSVLGSKLLLRSDITVMSALTLSAVSGVHGESGVAFTADHSVTLVFPREGEEIRFEFFHASVAHIFYLLIYK